MKLHQIHQFRAIWHGERDSLVALSCGLRVFLRENRERITHNEQEVTCRTCRKSMSLPRRPECSHP